MFREWKKVTPNKDDTHWAVEWFFIFYYLSNHYFMKLHNWRETYRAKILHQHAAILPLSKFIKNIGPACALTLFPTWIGVVLRVEPREVFNARSTFHEKDLCREQACKLKFKLRELVSCFCCVQTSHVVLEADSPGQQRNINRINRKWTLST